MMVVFVGTRAVIPIVGYLQDFHLSKLKPNKAEVQDVFVKSVLDLHRPHVAGYTQFRVPNSPGYSLPIYNCEPYPIWGMTAIITFQFLNVFLRKLCNFLPLNFKLWIFKRAEDSVSDLMHN